MQKFQDCSYLKLVQIVERIDFKKLFKLIISIIFFRWKGFSKKNKMAIFNVVGFDNKEIEVNGSKYEDEVEEGHEYKIANESDDENSENDDNRFKKKNTVLVISDSERTD